jgi:diguanylate cyclase (GGDEF)-like protein/PAS domain S-box-containing protein
MRLFSKHLSKRWIYTIRTKLVGVIALLIAAISFFILFYVPAGLENQAIRAIATKAQNIAEITAFRVRPGLYQKDRQNVEEALTGAYQNQDVLYVIMLDESGNELAAFNREKAIAAEFALAKGDSPISQDGSIYRTGIPIVNKGREIGQLYLGFSLEEVRGEIARSQRTIALVSFITFVVGIGAVFGISTVVISPLSRMAETVDQIAKGDLTQRAAVSSQDEVGHLAGSFNLMVSNLEEEINERKRAEEALLVEKAHLERLFESAQEAIVMTDCDGVVLRTNNEFTRLFGYTQEEAAGRLVDDLVAPDQRHEEAARLTKRVSKRKNVSVESVRWRKDGVPVQVSILGSPIVVHGETVGVYAIYRDITDRKKAEEALQRKTRQQAQLLQTARDLTESLELKEVLSRIGAGAREILKSHGCVIYLLEEDGQTLTPVAAIDPAFEEAVLSTQIKVETSFTGQAIKAKRGMLFNDVLDDSVGQQILGVPLDVNERIIAVPFYAGEKALGAMCLDRMGTQFTEEDLALAEAFALYATTALKNAKMYDDLQREIEERKLAEDAKRESRRKIEGLHVAARGLEACQREHEVYQMTVKSAEEILEFSMCSLDIVERNKLSVKAISTGLPPGASVETDLEETSLAGKTYRTGKTILFSNLDEVPEASPTRSDFKSGISAPIGDMGVFQVVSTEADAFTTEDVRLLELLLGHTAEGVRRIRLQNQLREQATQDPLTGLYNRRYFREIIEREMERSKRYQHSIGFLMIDVDNFKDINDTYGHQMGDRVLQEVADFLRNQVRAAEMVVRYGGDEFLVVMPELEDNTDIVKQRLVETFARWNQTSKTFDFTVGLSLGGAKWNPHGSESVEETLARADMLMYEDKRRNLKVQPAEKVHGGG